MSTEPAAATHGGFWHVAERASVSADEIEGNNNSGIPTISGDGQFVAFGSVATNLVPGDNNGTGDIFVRERISGDAIPSPFDPFERVSVDRNGREGNSSSTVDQPRMSNDGRFVAFTSQASNLAPSDTNGNISDVFVRDRQTGTTELVSVGPDAIQTTVPGDVQLSGMSADGQYVLFDSIAPLVPEDANGRNDMFLRDTVLDVTERVSVGTDGLEANGDSFGGVMSTDARYVAFTSRATNLGDNASGDQLVYFRDRTTDTTVRLLHFERTLAEFAFGISDDGAEVLLAKSFVGVLVVSRESGSIERVDVASDESPANGGVSGARMSGDGRFVVLTSLATNLAPEDADSGQDVFARDRQTGTTELVSISADGMPGNGPSGGSDDQAISADGQHITFTTQADNLVPGDTNGFLDVVVADQVAPPPPPPPPTSADLSITKSDSPDPVRVGNNLTYTLTVANLGPGTATDVILADRLPTRVEIVDIGSTQGECALLVDTDILCELGSLDSGSDADVGIVVRPSLVGTIENEGIVGSATPDPAPNNNRGTETTKVNPRAYVAMGDSFSSGTGTVDDLREYDSDAPQCRRSPRAYPRLFAPPASDIPLLHVACHGAKVPHVLTQQFHVLLNAATPDLVTITIGGNDIGFKWIFVRCADVFDCTLRDIPKRIESLKPILVDLYARLRLAAGDEALIFVLGYPITIPARGTAPICSGISGDERDLLRSLGNDLNDTIEEAVTDSGDPELFFVDVRRAFEGHEICTADRWVNNFFEIGLFESFHPNVFGHEKLFDCLNDAVFQSRLECLPQ